MLASLPNIRVGLMVGIGAGVPTAGIRLGDVVVSQPESTHGGVVQYDAYKARVVGTQRSEELRGFLRAPPDALLSTLSKVRSTHEMGDSAVAVFLEEAFEKRPQLKEKFGYPGAFYNDPERPTVTDASFAVHYGTIASGEVLIKNAEERDAILERLLTGNIKALCFEMEAAGLMNNFPCLVIRGICDYADERKNDHWQNYAALVAAAFAKDFLKHVQRKRIEQTPTIGDAVQQIQSDVVDIHARLQSLQEKSQLSEISRWLCAPDLSSNYNKAREQRHLGTGSWFLEGDTFTQWKDSPHSFLWLHGLAGCGKTVLSTSVIEHLAHLAQQDGSHSTAVIYFYFDFNDSTKQRLESMARSLVAQCSYQSKDIAKPLLDQLFERFESGGKQPTTEALLATLLTMFQNMGRVRVVLDALDECTTRKELLRWLKEVISLKLKDVQLLVTSRREHDIESSIVKWASPREIAEIQEALVDEDIRAYILARLAEQSSKLKRWHTRPTVQHEIAAKLMEKAGGMFRWAACQLDGLEDCLDLLVLRKALASLPRSLSETYDRILTNIPAGYKDHAVRILQFLVYSDRPLLLEEAVDAVATPSDRMGVLDPQYRMPDPREIKRICSSLVIGTRMERARDRSQYREQLQLAHLSVKEYLTSDQVAEYFQNHLRESAARSTIARVSLVYLLSLDSSLSTTQIKTNFPLSVYSARSWMEHALQGGEEDDALQSLILRLFASRQQAYFTWLCMFDPDRPWAEGSLDVKESLADPLYYASLGGLRRSVRSILDIGTNVNAQGGRYGSAINAASAAGRVGTVELLLNTGKANVNLKDMLGRHSLSLAAEHGHDAVVELLLGTDVDVDSKDNQSQSPLSLAAQNGHEATINLLLGTAKVDINSEDGHGQTPLSLAAQNGHRAVVKLLLDTGKATIDSKDSRGQTPLSRAAKYGHEATVKLLIDTGKVDVDSKDNHGQSPLFYAVEHEHEAVVELLLQNGADVDAHGPFYDTLQAASFGGNEMIVELLLHYGAHKWAMSDATPSIHDVE